METTTTIDRLRATGFSMRSLIESQDRDDQHCVDAINSPEGAEMRGMIRKGVGAFTPTNKKRLASIVLKTTNQQAGLIIELLKGV